MTSTLAQNKRTLSNPQTIGEVLMKELLINNEKINRALKKYPHMQEASFNQSGRGQSICYSEVDTYHQQDGGLFPSRMGAVPFGGAPCSREAPSRLLYSQHFKRLSRSPNQ